jgi:ABC-type dipeptide/oligopeptide/nickel transport system permease component
MLRYAAKRVATAFAVLVAVSILAFTLTDLSVDQAAALAGADATASDIARVRKDYGLDRPMPERYLGWASRALRGDLGQSLHYKQPVMTLIAERMPVTAILALCSIAFALLIALPLGIGGAMRPGALLDRFGVAVAVLGQAVPSFWTSLMLIVIFGVDLGWLPISGSDTAENFVMPTIALGIFTMPVLLRLTRAGMIDVLGTEYVRAARARGLRPARVVLKHALRNAAMPLVAVAAVQFGYLLGGSIVTEQIFAMHGVGYLAWQAILIGDTAIVQAVVLLMTFVYAILTLGSDLLNAWFDPRIRIA